MSSEKWTVADVPDQTGRTVMVTGGTSGIGKEAARVLAGRGAHVVLPSITRAEGEAAAADIGGSTEVHELDLASFDGIRAFADSYDGEIDVLLDNAGLMSKTLKCTRDGVELHWGVNFLGPYLLTALLLPRIRERVVITASMAHAKGEIDLDDTDLTRRGYDMGAAYANSKLACMLWGLGLQERLQEAGSTVDVQLAHPGFALTTILELTPSKRVNDVLKRIAGPVVPSAVDGARPLLYAATRELPPVSYVGPTGPFQVGGTPGPCSRAPRAEDPASARRLLEYADAVTGLIGA